MTATSTLEESILELSRSLISCPTPNPPGDEAKVVEILAERLRSSSVEFELTRQKLEPSRENVIARAGDPKYGSVLLTGHTDTVPANVENWNGDPYELRHDGDRVIGRGIADMKGAVAAKVIAAEAFLEAHETTGEVILGLVADEENSGAGTVAMIDEGIEADAAILGEPTNMQPAIASYGFLAYNITVTGESGHSGRPDRSTNAIDGLRMALDQVADLDREIREEDHPVLEPGPSISATEIEGGTAPNVVPGRSTATISWRALPADTFVPEQFDRRLEAALGTIEVDGEPVDVEIDRWIAARPAEISPDEPIVEALIATAAEEGRDCEPTGFNAGSDARYLINDAGIPTVLFGPGSVEDNAHTVNESIALDDLTATARIYRRALERFLAVD